MNLKQAMKKAKETGKPQKVTKQKTEAPVEVKKQKPNYHLIFMIKEPKLIVLSYPNKKSVLADAKSMNLPSGGYKIIKGSVLV